ncbi:class I SAM-dependent methyltransferase [Planococcus shenhongbingii]|uniref:Class I SAM-dependent methyltransferase n=1 Tax=Planococcus shenhongbingii TaxID=3058398 RepID=A0ABT8NB76_9BACL|nr:MULTISPECIES: class I SAM-dependent methyltransferase [unclassified Planococcus (in: firmicutes)]MDN7245142.1 class I SAM-dependent methyltransferase [Planococcus sp. N017]WKA58238.1 class I SAM-dependent methyltransferase [Planococcus sp. N016]
MKLYKELAEWWPLMSPHTEYEEEASLYLEIIRRYHPDIKTALEFGSGGGSNAYYLKRHFSMTLTDLSPDMLEVSRKLNPECEHFQGDMRNLVLDAKFDLVFIHDAIMYLTTGEDLLEVMRNAKRHLNENGILFIMTDQFEETFRPETSHGGVDKDGRGMRYLEWTYDSDPEDQITETEYAYILRDENGNVFREYDHAKSGLFSMGEWEELLRGAGFKAIFEQINYTSVDGIYYGIVAAQTKT